MGTQPEELTHEIDQTRQRLSADIDALEDKVSPSAIVGRRKEAARRSAGNLRDRLMGSAHAVGDHASGLTDQAGDTADQAKQAAQERYEGSPLAAGLVAFGAGALLAALLPATRAEARTGSALVEQVKEKAQPVVDDAKQAAAQVGEDLKDSAQAAAQEVKESAADSAATVRDEGRSAADDVRSETQA